jgi:hypothetical protein
MHIKPTKTSNNQENRSRVSYSSTRMNETGDAPEQTDLHRARIRRVSRVTNHVSTLTRNLGRRIPNPLKPSETTTVHRMPALIRTIPNLYGRMPLSWGITRFTLLRIFEPIEGKINRGGTTRVIIIVLFCLLFLLLTVRTTRGKTSKLHI